MSNKVYTSGKAVSEDKHMELLKVLTQFERKTRTVLDKEDATVDVINELLTRFDEVVIKLDNWNVLVIH